MSSKLDAIIANHRAEMKRIAQEDHTYWVERVTYWENRIPVWRDVGDKRMQKKCKMRMLWAMHRATNALSNVHKYGT
jgi:hypothetical protein